MYEKYIMIVLGLVLIFASVWVKGFSYGMPPHPQKPQYGATRPLRVVLLSFGLVSLAFGLIGVLRK